MSALHNTTTNTTSIDDIENKAAIEHREHAAAVRLAVIDEKHKHDAALNILGDDRVEMTDAQSRQVLRKIDMTILPILAWIYFLQILDKSVIGYGAVLGLQAETHLVGNQYSLLGSCGYWAQLAWQPFSAIVIVKVPTKILMSTIVFCWGVAMVGLAFSKSFAPLMVNRFLLGLFEASCLPLFTLITSAWYRRSEQPWRVAIWYGTNGLATVLGSLLAYGLSFIPHPTLYVYQILFLMVGIATILSSAIVWFRLADNPAVAYFLTEEERRWAVERLRDNNTGIQTMEVKWSQILEAVTSPMIWLYTALTFGVNAGASVSNVFGPIIIGGIGFNARTSLLLNMPFGTIQMLVIAFSILVASRFKRKTPIMALLTLPCIAGAALLYALGRGKQYTGPLLTGYYLIGFLYGCNPLIVSWMSSNMSGYTKKAVGMSFYNVGNAVGNIVGPLLFKAAEKPVYKSGLKGIMGIFISVFCATLLQFGLLVFLNRRKEKTRVANGKPAKLEDRSMDSKYVAGQNKDLGDNAFLDLTDMQNDEFIYTL